MISWDECDDDDMKEDVEGENANNVYNVNIMITKILASIRQVRIQAELSNQYMEDEWTILLDTCAEESAFRNRRLFHHISM